MATGKAIKQNKKLILKRYQYTFSGGIVARGTRRIASNAMSPSYHHPDGYKPIAIRYFSTGSVSVVADYIVPQNQDTESTNYFLAVKNATDSDVTSDITFLVDILFAPAEMVETITS